MLVIVAALLPLTLIALHAVGGISGLEKKVKAFKPLGEPGLHAWRGLAIHHVTNPPLTSDWVGVVFGLGFVLGFGYWTTNFAEVQRALSARNMSGFTSYAADRRLPEDLPAGDHHPPRVDTTPRSPWSPTT